MYSRVGKEGIYTSAVRNIITPKKGVSKMERKYLKAPKNWQGTNMRLSAVYLIISLATTVYCLFNLLL